MTRDEVVEMAMKTTSNEGTRLYPDWWGTPVFLLMLERFAHLVEQRTREKCIQAMWDGTDNMHQESDMAFKAIIEDAIRATSTLQASKVEGR